MLGKVILVHSGWWERTEVAPSLTILRLHLHNSAEEFERFLVRFLALVQHANSVHGSCRVGIGLQCALVSVQRLIRDAQELREASYRACKLAKSHEKRIDMAAYRFGARHAR